MMKTVAVAVVLVLGSGCAHHSWSEDKMHILSQAAMAYDLLCQTRDIRDHADTVEINPLLSRNPSDREVVSYWITSAIVNEVAYHWIKSTWPDKRWHELWSAGHVMRDAYLIQSNHKQDLDCW